MSVLLPHPDNTTQAAENCFLFSDWELPQQGTFSETPPFDGKIIARMPDLGADCFTKNIETSNFSSYWTQVIAHASSVIQEKITAFKNAPPSVRQQFFHRLTMFGCVVLLCGVVFLLFERGNKTPENPIDIADTVSENVEPPVTSEPAVVIRETSPFVPIFQPEPNVMPSVAVDTVPPTAVDLLVQTDSVWNRTPSNPHSPWEHAPRQPAPPVPPAAVAMTPMIDMSMQISPHEQQLLAQSNPPVQPPFDPFLQTPAPTGPIVPGMVPTHARQDSAPPMMPMHTQQNNAPPGIATSQGARQSVSPPLHPQYMPPSAVPNMHLPYTQQYPQTAPPNMPIPSGVSTLSPQGAHYPQQPHGIASPQYPAGNYYHNAPSMWR